MPEWSDASSRSGTGQAALCQNVNEEIIHYRIDPFSILTFAACYATFDGAVVNNIGG